MENYSLLQEEFLKSIPEKIDTISIKLSADCINLNLLNSICWHVVPKGFSVFHTYTVKKGLNLRRTISDMKTHYYCDIQYEFIFSELLYNVNNHRSIFNVILSALMQLEANGFLIAPDYFSIPEEIRLRENNFSENLLKILWNYNKIAKLTELDFAFDYKKGQIRCFDDCVKYDSTCYSNEGKGKSGKKVRSKWICYDRIAKEKAKRQESFSAIENMPYPQRLEIRLGSDCEYLDLANLNGNYYDVAFRFAPVIAKSWKKHGIAEVQKVQEHIVFNYILYLSDCGETPKLSDELKKKERNARKEKVNPDEPLII